MANIITWEKCDCCDDYICNFHVGQHAFECSCPTIDQWAEHDLSPYFEEPEEKVTRFLETVKLEEE